MSNRKVKCKGKKLLGCLMTILLIILSCYNTWAAQPETYVLGDEFTEGVLKYRIIDEENKCVEVAEQNNQVILTGGVLDIPDVITHDGITYLVTRIGDNAFENNNSLNEVNISDGITDIGDNAFYSCINLNNVIIPKSVEKIGVNAFRGCVKFTDIEIPEGVKEISEDAFSSCPNVSKISLPSSLETIGNKAFSVSGNLTDGLTVIIKDGVKRIGEFAFASCAEIKEITIPSSVEALGSNAFDGCKNLEKVIIEGEIIKIPSGLFRACESLKYIKIPDSVTNIGLRAFSGCTGLESITIPSSIMEFNSAFIFENCTSLREMKIAVNVNKEDIISVTPITIDELTPCFQGIPSDRRLVFLNSDGTKELAGTSLVAAQQAYMAEDDGDTTDNYWYGWEIGTVADLYTVTVDVKKDGEKWEDHGKQFLLKNENGYLIDDFQAENGTYTVCVKIGETVLDTGVTVKVEDSDTSVTIEYFTVTFLDGDTPYNDDTAWGKQIVREGEKVVMPTSNPEKTGYEFTGWKTDKEGNEDFDFEMRITTATGIYAGWEKTSEIPIEPSKPSESETPSEPTKPEAPTENPSEPTKPETPTENPNEPTKPETPTENPSEPTKPEAPTENPNEPTKPETPTVAPSKPSVNNPINSDTSEKSDEDVSEMEEPETDGIIDEAGEDEKPITGDMTHVEIYATAAMIAGLSYVMLIFTKRKKGMSEEEKNTHVSALIEWAKKGSRVRKYMALTAICFLLLYYHSIGKRLDLEWEEICGN